MAFLAFHDFAAAAAMRHAHAAARAGAPVEASRAATPTQAAPQGHR